MRVRFIAPLTAALIAGSIALTAGPAAAAPSPAPATAAPRATITDASIQGAVQDLQGNTVGTLTGTFTPTSFSTSNGQLVANGLVTGTITYATGAVTQITGQSASAPITGAADPASCRVLDLTLGPLHLDLLGLVVDLNQVHLTITAVQGPGNLLGNLLCAVANLLNGGTIGAGLATLLNQLLGLLGGL